MTLHEQWGSQVATISNDFKFQSQAVRTRLRTEANYCTFLHKREPKIDDTDLILHLLQFASVHPRFHHKSYSRAAPKNLGMYPLLIRTPQLVGGRFTATLHQNFFSWHSLPWRSTPQDHVKHLSRAQKRFRVSDISVGLKYSASK